MFFHINLGSQGFQRLLKQVPIYRSVLQNIKLQLSFHPYGAEYMIAVSQFRVCILRRTRPLRSSKTVEPLEHFLVASPDVLPLCHDFCRSGPQKWRSTPHDVTIFSLSLFFFGHAKNLGMCEAMTDSSILQKEGKEGALNRDRLHAVLWRNWPSNVSSEGCRPWIETQQMTELSFVGELVL